MIPTLKMPSSTSLAQKSFRWWVKVSQWQHRLLLVIIYSILHVQYDNAVYFLLTEPSVNLTSGLCTVYCGWHWMTSRPVAPFGNVMKYSVVPNTMNNPACSAGGCGVGQTVSANSDVLDGVDDMFS
jgi:hypothetical protein